MEILTVPIQELVFDPVNPRAHPTENISAIRESLKRFGQVLPVLVRDSDSQIVAGNGTVMAMQELGWQECQIALYDGNDQECRALSVALNRTGELAMWDENNLAAAVGELRASGFEAMESLGFDPQILGDLTSQFQAAGGEVPQPTAPGEEWVGMPEHEQQSEPFCLNIMFDTEEEREAAVKELRLFVIKRTTRTWSTTWGKERLNDYSGERFEDAG